MGMAVCRATREEAKMRDCCRITAPINGEFATEARPRLDSLVCVMEVGNKSQPNLALQVWPITVSSFLPEAADIKSGM
jgi:hypothetical protein